MEWNVEIVRDAAEELRALPVDMRASFDRIVGLIRKYGLLEVREPYIKHLESDLWEMRLKGRDGIARAIYMTARARRVVVLRVFRKKTSKTPRQEIALARRRAKEVK